MTGLAALEARLQRIEDELAICRLIASYSPLVDSGASDRAPLLWLADGVYDTDAVRLTGSGEIEAMLTSEGHRAFIDAGAAHVMGFPVVDIDGDRATAVNYSRVYVREETAFRVDRVSANYWLLERSVKGWRVRERINRLVGPDQRASRLMGANVKDPDAA